MNKNIPNVMDQNTRHQARLIAIYAIIFNISKHYIGIYLHNTMQNLITEQSSEQIVVRDSCVATGALRSLKTRIKIRALFKGKHSRIALQDVILAEVHKVTGFSKEEIIIKISAILGKEVHVFATTENMKIEARGIEQKYSICHFPDSLIVAACKLFSWILLSFDRNILRSADFEGIIALNPARVRRF